MNSTTGSGVGFTIYPEELQMNDVVAVARLHRTLSLSRDLEFRERIQRGRETLERKLKNGEVIYGVNTGFGGNVRFVIPDQELAHHQLNLLEYLCCGVGEPLPGGSGAGGHITACERLGSRLVGGPGSCDRKTS